MAYINTNPSHKGGRDLSRGKGCQHWQKSFNFHISDRGHTPQTNINHICRSCVHAIIDPDGTFHYAPICEDCETGVCRKHYEKKK